MASDQDIYNGGIKGWMMSEPSRTIEVGEEGYGFPITEILTGRGFCSGKSGSGKTNTVSVIVERLLDNNLPLLIVDTEGEYYPLKESYEILHVGPNEDGYDKGVSPGGVSEIVDVSLHQNVPVILDLSGFDTEETATEIVEETLSQLFEREKSVEKPYLIVVEEIHEYVPEKGGFDSLAEKIIRIAKRGRKRGLGICGVSQRPAAVAKDYITQCGWLIWHRLTWDNDVDVARRILGSEYADQITELETGEAFVLADWREDIDRVKFLRKQTYDAGSTPGLEAIERTNTSEMDEDLSEAIKPTVTGRSEEDLRGALREKEERISELQAQVDRLEADSSENVHGDGTANQDSTTEVPREQTDNLVLEFSSFVIYLTTLLTRGIVSTVQWLNTEIGRAIQGFQAVYERQREEENTRVRRALLLATIVLVVVGVGVLLRELVTALLSIT